jgi:hypothetical protein
VPPLFIDVRVVGEIEGMNLLKTRRTKSTRDGIDDSRAWQKSFLSGRRINLTALAFLAVLLEPSHQIKLL